MNQMSTQNNHMPHDFFLIILSTKYKLKHSLFLHLQVSLIRTVPNEGEKIRAIEHIKKIYIYIYIYIIVKIKV